MEGPEISGPKIWLDLNKKGEAKVLDLMRKNEERFNWLDQYVQECKKKLGVDQVEEPSFVPKVSEYSLFLILSFLFSIELNLRHRVRKGELREEEGKAKPDLMTLFFKKRFLSSKLLEEED